VTQTAERCSRVYPTVLHLSAHPLCWAKETLLLMAVCLAHKNCKNTDEKLK